MTKLKFAILNTKDRISLFDTARLINPLTGTQYTAPFSLWKVLRGEPSIYEKYGYTSVAFDTYRAAAGGITWDKIKKGIVHPRTGMSLEQLWAYAYPEKPISDHMTIKNVMKTIAYEETERSVIEVPLYSEELEAQIRKIYEAGEEDPSTISYTYKTSIVDQILVSIIKNAGVRNFGTIELQVNKSNPIWQHWNSRLKIISFDPVLSGGRKHVTYRRRYTRRIKYRK
jgi:hypothetical protein